MVQDNLGEPMPDKLGNNATDGTALSDDAAQTPEQQVAATDAASSTQPPETDETRDPVELLADEFIACLRRGDNPTVAEYAERLPECADEIRELFPTIAAMEQLKVGKEQSADGRASLGPTHLKQLGDFRIIGEIGRGGMGIVYEAEQESLQRRVAVKVLPRQALLDSKQLRRFEREARTAARLHHTNIVPIFGVGEQEGYHYYAMQFIRGVGLDQVLVYLEQTATTSPSGHPSQTVATDAGAGESGSPSEVARITDALLRGRFVRTPQRAITPASDGKAESTLHQAPTEPLTTASPAKGTPQSQSTHEIVQLPGTSPKTPNEASAASSASEDRQVARQTDETEEYQRGDLPGISGKETDSSELSESELVQETVLKTRRYDPVYWKSVARIGIQVAEALGYAHKQDTLHRDIKPANLLLDADGVVWVTDFGLAKAMQHDDISQTGDIVGTLRYMAPEQFHGEADSRADIYSLGLTLYELLTWKPAFDATSRQGLVQRVMHEEPTRPRVWVPAIPRDLETIVLKAMSREPEHRYQTAAQLAEDLACFLDDRPISARRVSGFERLRRWCRRNRAMAALSGTALALLVLIAVVASVGYIQTRAANLREREQRQKAEATSTLAVEALDRIFYQFAPSRIVTPEELTVAGAEGEEYEVPTQPVLSKGAATLLENLLVFYDRLADQSSDEIRFRQKAADANRRVGDIRRSLGQYELAETAYKNAIDKYEQLEADSVASGAEHTTGYPVEKAALYNELGNVYRATRQQDQMYASHKQALTILRSVPSSAASAPDVRYELARTYYLLGRPHGPGEAPLRFPRPAPFGHLRPGGRKPPGPTNDRPLRVPHGPTNQHVAKGPRGRMHQQEYRLPSPFRSRTRRFRDSSREYRQKYAQPATQLLHDLVQEFPNVSEYRYLLALCYRDLRPNVFGNSKDASGQPMQQATALLEQLVSEHPEVPDYRYELAQTYVMDSYRWPRSDPASDATAEQRLRLALQHSDKLVAEHPNVPEYAASNAYICHWLGIQLARTLSSKGEEAEPAREEEAENTLRKALDRQLALVRQFPDVPTYRVRAAKFRNSLAGFLSSQGQQDSAIQLLTVSAQELRDLLETELERPGLWFVHGTLFEAYQGLRQAYEKKNSTATAAEEAGQQADAHRHRMQELRDRFMQSRSPHR